MTHNQPLFEEYDVLSKHGVLKKDIPSHIRDNLNPRFKLRPYQVEALARFFHYVDKDSNKEISIHLLFQMATGSGKTLLMAALVLHLYKQGYRNFLFFVNRTNIIDKTKDNFLEKTSSKYLFAEKITIDGQAVNVNSVEAFDGVGKTDINIHFTTIQGFDDTPKDGKENSLTDEDFVHNKVVFLVDEAHHINASTRKKGKRDSDSISWEGTVMDLYKKNPGNYLLEFTATIDTSGEVEQKYRDKKIYQYDLKQFRNDLYSKEVDILQSDTDLKTRVLQAVLISYYREQIAQESGINLKSVILFKSQKIIDSKQNHADFLEDLQKLDSGDLEIIYRRTNIDLLKKVFAYFEEKKISLNSVCEGIRRNFSREKTLNVNAEKDVEEFQRQLNSLEDKNNEIRAIFAVDKLNEGWDVLNLFDIVRMYETRQSGHGKISPATISEAQLIGRGARYFPFVYGDEDERFKRKYDGDQDHPLRILEEFYYHSHDDSRYIGEIKEALRQSGLMDGDETKKVTITLKDEVVHSDFYQRGKVFKNERKRKRFDGSEEVVLAGLDALLKEAPIEVDVSSFRGKKIHSLEEGEENLYVVKSSSDVPLETMERHLIKNAFARSGWFTFEKIKTYFPHVRSMDEFINDDRCFGKMKITFRRAQGDALSHEYKLKGILLLLDKVKGFIEKTNEQFEGTEFSDHFVHEIFTIKKTFKTKNNQSLEEYLKNKGWYAYDSLYGTSEEEGLVRLIERLHDELKAKYKEIYLVRNERMLDIYDKEGRRFEPDFVLFGIGFSGEDVHYQCFLESKGEYLQLWDNWKNDFLKKMQGDKEGVFRFTSGSNRHILTAVPFYNSKNDVEVEEEIRETMRLK